LHLVSRAPSVLRKGDLPIGATLPENDAENVRRCL
jgi:hypothetical protein